MVLNPSHTVRQFFLHVEVDENNIILLPLRMLCNLLRFQIQLQKVKFLHTLDIDIVGLS